MHSKVKITKEIKLIFNEEEVVYLMKLLQNYLGHGGEPASDYSKRQEIYEELVKLLRES